MLTAVAIIVGAILLGWREYLQHRTTVALVDSITAERDCFIATIEQLCQRIQAPEQAVFEHSVEVAPHDTPRVIPADDDQAFWEAQQLTREQLAQAAMEAELTGSVHE